MPPTASDYTEAGLPWFDYYADKQSLAGSKVLKTLKSVAAKTIEGRATLKDNEPVAPKIVKTLGVGVVRDGEF